MKFIFWIAIIIAIAGILMYLGILSIAKYHGVVYIYAFWVEVFSVGLLAITAIFKNKAVL
jgi:hypothetical protein